MALVIESHDPSARSLRSYLEMAGLTVDIAHNAKEAIALVEAKPYYIVFLNSWLPDQPGRAVAERIRGSEPNASAPIIVVSPDDRADTRREMIKSGCQEFLIMPVDFAHIGALLERWGVVRDGSQRDV